MSSLTEQSDTPAELPGQAESTFIRFCQEVAKDNQTKVRYWSKNLDRFERVFVKFRQHENLSVPVKKFIDSKRATLEKKVLSGDEANDKWLLIDEDEPVPEPREGAAKWTPLKPRGVFLSATDDQEDWSHCLPLSEVYRACLDICSEEVKTLSGGVRKSFSGVTVDSVPAKFLQLLYQMFLEVEPDNTHFKSSVDLLDEIITPSTDSFGDMAKMAATMMSAAAGSGGLEGLFGSVSDVLKNLDPATREAAMGTAAELSRAASGQSDFSGVMNSVNNFLSQGGMDGLKQMFASMQGMSQTSGGEESSGGDGGDGGDGGALMIEGPDDQE